ncbi:MAG: M28 family peptidase [Geitlerinemataceae cyanobacterium]
MNTPRTISQFYRRPVTRIALALCVFAIAVLLGCAAGSDVPDAPPAEPALESTDDSSPLAAMTPNPLRVDRERLMARIDEFSQPRFTAAERARAREYLAERLRGRGWLPQNEAFQISDDNRPTMDGVNLIAEKPGTDPSLPPLLIGAHYDTVRDSPGADDNGSGSIALLEIAELLGDPDLQFPRGLRLVWFDLEEVGLLGSFYHVGQFASSVSDGTSDSTDASTYPRPSGAIVLEMLGYACDEPGCQSVPSGLAIVLPDRGTFLGVLGDADHPELLAPFVTAAKASPEARDRAEHPPLVTLPVPTQLAIAPNLLRSDHAPFWIEGIGALMVTDTANFRNPHYHQPSDTASTLAPEFFARSTQVVLDAAIALLNDPTPEPNPEPNPKSNPELPAQ